MVEILFLYFIGIKIVKKEGINITDHFKDGSLFEILFVGEGGGLILTPHPHHLIPLCSGASHDGAAIECILNDHDHHPPIFWKTFL